MNTQMTEKTVSEMDLHKLRLQASETVLRDLVNALIHENLLDITDRGVITGILPGMPSLPQFDLAVGEQYFVLNLNASEAIVFRVKRQQFIQSMKISRLPVLLVTKHPEFSQQPIGPVKLMRLLATTVSDDARSSLLPNLAEFMVELQDAVEHTALSLEAASEFEGGNDACTSSLLRMERLSSLRDRPFHPTSRSKRGWDHSDYRNYSPEFGNVFGLDWVAVRRDHVIQGQTAEDIAGYLLNDSERIRLDAAMDAAGINREQYLPVPVHPWQMEHSISRIFIDEIESNVVIPIIKGLGTFSATSSVRGLSPAHGGRFHVKVPIGIYSLAALRILPPRYLNNGERAQDLLQRVIDGEPMLRNRLHLCSEQLWWGFNEPDGDPFDDKPGHLACLIREYPAHLTESTDDTLIAMSALAVMDSIGRVPAFAGLLKSRYGAYSRQSEVLGLFRDICEQFIETAFICFRYGVMPEVHGQNVMLVVRDGQITGLLLRDHDTVRLHVPWLEREGFTDPRYIVNPGTPNSLINEAPEALLSYFQTLGIQVNLYAIIDVLSKSYEIEEAEFWRQMRAVIHSCLNRMNFPETVREVISQQLLYNSKWPTRTLITPLLKRTGTGGGSMPADTGETVNPLQACET